MTILYYITPLLQVFCLQFLSITIIYSIAAPWVATTVAWPVPAPVARGPTRTAEPLLLALGRYWTRTMRVME